MTVCVQEGTSDCGWSQSTPQVRDAEDSAGEGSAVFVRGEDDSLHVPSSGLGWPHRPCSTELFANCWASRKAEFLALLGGGEEPAPRPGGEGSGGLL